jgi:hypothetical protein
LWMRTKVSAAQQAGSSRILGKWRMSMSGRQARAAGGLTGQHVLFVEGELVVEHSLDILRPAGTSCVFATNSVPPSTAPSLRSGWSASGATSRCCGSWACRRQLAA